MTEIALAASLLVCAGLTLRSLHALMGVDLGFATEQRFSFKTNLTERDYPDAARVDRFYEQLTARLESLPGTVSIGAISYLPLSGEGQSVDGSAGAPARAAAPRLTVGWGIVRGRYFETMGIALLQRPALLDRRSIRARRPWRSWTTCSRGGCGPSEAAAIGQQVRFGAGPRAETRTVVGVVHHVSHVEPGRQSLPMAYAPQSQVYQRGMYTRDQDDERAAGADAGGAGGAGSRRPVGADVLRRNGRTRGTTRRLRCRDSPPGWSSAFSTLALLLAGVGIFGVTGYAVAQRTREFGIRFALGAQRGHVGALVLGRVALLAGIGLALGAAVGLGLGSLMSGILFGVRARRPADAGAAMGAIGLTAMLASLAPLRHAVLVNPVETLRAE